jgi:hypothetical protein
MIRPEQFSQTLDASTGNSRSERSHKTVEHEIVVDDLFAAALHLIWVKSQSRSDLSGVASQATRLGRSDGMIFVIEGPEPVQDCHVALQDGKERVLLVAGKVRLVPMENRIGCFQHTEKARNPAVKKERE